MAYTQVLAELPHLPVWWPALLQDPEPWLSRGVRLSQLGKGPCLDLGTDIQIPNLVNGSYWYSDIVRILFFLTLSPDNWFWSVSFVPGIPQFLQMHLQQKGNNTFRSTDRKTFFSQMRNENNECIKNPKDKTQYSRQYDTQEPSPLKGQRAAYREIGAKFQFSDKILLGTMREHFSAGWSVCFWTETVSLMTM